MLADNELGSIVAMVARSIGDARSEWSGVPFYYGTVPDGFERPSVHVPPDDAQTFGDTLDSFRTRRSLWVYFFGRDAMETRAMAEAARAAVARSRMSVPVVDADAEPTGWALDIVEASTRMVAQNPGTCILSLAWDHRERYPEPDAPMLELVDIELFVRAVREGAGGNG